MFPLSLQSIISNEMRPLAYLVKFHVRTFLVITKVTLNIVSHV